MTTTEAPYLYRYGNGNCVVTIYADGTKVREWPNGTSAQPEFPESIDLKITNTCDRGCAWCHESAAQESAHASLGRISEVVEGLPSGVECAIGGGNPLAHPGLGSILQDFKNRQLVSNITVHGLHLFGAFARLKQLQQEHYLYGVGVSDPSTYRMLFNNDMLPDHAVCHAIVGIDDPLEVAKLRAAGCKVLVLGYKTYGRGAVYPDKDVAGNIGRWQYFINTVLSQSNGILSFDNLALNQLNIKSRVPDDVWAERYMGNDGAFSMYFDAVRNEYAASSIGARQRAGEMTIAQMFRTLV